MKSSIFGILVIAAFTSGLPRARVTEGIAPRDRYPYLVSIQSSLFGQQHTCGGTIISPKWVVTAAHCVGISLLVSQIVAGAFELNDSENPSVQIRYIDLYNVVKHPNYNGINNDIALLKMTEPFEFNRDVKPLPISKIACYALDETNIFSSWGNRGSQLQTANMAIVPFDKCYEIIKSVYGNNVRIDRSLHICVSGAGSPCLLDGGGPLVQDNRLIGLLSWLPSACLEDKVPAIFTNTGYFKDFIKQHVDDLELQANLA